MTCTGTSGDCLFLLESHHLLSHFVFLLSPPQAACAGAKQCVTKLEADLEHLSRQSVAAKEQANDLGMQRDHLQVWMQGRFVSHGQSGEMMKGGIHAGWVTHQSMQEAIGVKE